MRVKLVFTLAPVALSISLVACHTQPAAAPRCQLDLALLKQVDGERLLDDVRRLVAFGERQSAAKQREVAAWLADRLDKLGYEVEQLPFSVRFTQDITISGVNVAAGREGLHGDSASDGIEVFLGAHFDSRGTNGLAPGALDNASGTAAVLEIARLLSACTTARDLRFVLFSKEESGDVGSQHYVDNLDRARDGMRTYLNVDMLGCGASARSSLQLIVQRDHAEFARRAAATADRWTKMHVRLDEHDSCFWSTDTGPFCDVGDAALAISNADGSDCWQRIHSDQDTIDLLQPEAFVEATRATLAMVLDEACPAALSGP